MTRSIRSLLAIVVLSTVAFSQQGILRTNAFFQGGIEVVDLELFAAPNSFFDIYYALDLNLTGLTHLTAGMTDATGQWHMYVPVQGNFQIQQLWLGAIVHPAAGGAFVAGPCAIAAAAAVAPCIPTGALSWDPGTCTATLVAKVCPGDTVSLVINGVVVLSAVAPASGQVVLAQGGLCGLPAGSAISGTRNGGPFLGAVHTGP